MRTRKFCILVFHEIGEVGSFPALFLVRLQIHTREKYSGLLSNIFSRYMTFVSQFFVLVSLFFIQNQICKQLKAVDGKNECEEEIDRARAEDSHFYPKTLPPFFYITTHLVLILLENIAALIIYITSGYLWLCNPISECMPLWQSVLASLRLIKVLSHATVINHGRSKEGCIPISCLKCGTICRTP